MGIVYKAYDERLGRHVALKFLPPHLSADPAAKTRFIAEARAAAALDHPSVCTIYEIGETEDGQLFIAMPLYDGETLQARLQRGRLMFDEALPIALQVARGLAHAHESGIVHRDVKPSNIVLLPDGGAKVLDFGIAQIQSRAPSDSNTLVGTVSYMSPEQANAGAIDHRTDIWSLAVVIHEMLAGARPFRGDNRASVLRAILTEDPRVTATSYPDVPAGLERVLRRALAKDADQRYATMSLLIADLTAVATVADERVMSTTERRRAAVLVSVVSDYAVAGRSDDAHRRAAPRRAWCATRRSTSFARTEVSSIRRSATRSSPSSACRSRTTTTICARCGRRWSCMRGCRRSRPPPSHRACRLSIQSGLHVGPVVARRLHEGPRRYDIVGAPAATAARLAALADRDSVWISAETQRLVGPYVQTEPRAPVVLDSQAGPVTPFRVLGETGIATRLEASSRTGLTPYVGRQSELSTLQSHRRPRRKRHRRRDRGGRRAGRRQEPFALRAAARLRGSARRCAC